MVWPWHTAKVVVCWCVDVRVCVMVCVSDGVCVRASAHTCMCWLPRKPPSILDSLCDLGFDLYYQEGALYYQVEEDVTNLFA